MSQEISVQCRMFRETLHRSYNILSELRKTKSQFKYPYIKHWDPTNEASKKIVEFLKHIKLNNLI